MKILIIGSGGREHAIGIALQKSKHSPELFFAPGNAGTREIGTNLPISDSDIDGLLTAAKSNQIDLVFVGPEAPLVLGITDYFKSSGIPIVGPSKIGAQLEGSKEWAKAFMKRHNIPTADYETFTNAEKAVAYLKSKNEYPIVIKADGLAAGKGVTVAQTEAEAVQAIEDCLIDNRFSDAGHKVVIESFLVGEEASIFAFCDGKTIIPMLPAQDHKAIFDGDKGPNTGGMGAYCPAPIANQKVQAFAYEKVFLPLLKGFQDENIEYKGIVYAGLMVQGDSASIVEFNARFGDPETQVVLPLLETDLLDIFFAIANQTLSDIQLKWRNQSAVTVVIAANGYPNTYPKGVEITSLPQNEADLTVIHAGTQYKDGKLVNSGGRVLNIVGKAATLSSAITVAYKGVEQVVFSAKYNRTDIGAKAFNAPREAR